MRIISGKFKGAKLFSPKNSRIRPTSDRAREMIFDTLNSILLSRKKKFTQINVLDGFCGTGALGIESLSRGSNSVTFIDLSKKSLELTRKNCENLNLLSCCSFVKMDLTKINKEIKTFDLFFLDPPYFGNVIDISLNNIANSKWIKKHSLGVIEVGKNQKLIIPDSMKLIKKKQVSSSLFYFLIKL